MPSRIPWSTLEPIVKRMRREPTPAEGRLWEYLRDGQVGGAKFRRQHPIGQFVVDFYCPRLRLAIEVDGRVHDSRRIEDAAREQYLKEHGRRVIRFSNREVLTEIDEVIEKTRIAVAP